MSRLRVACIGAGYFSQFHYGSWSRMDRVKVVGACDQDIDKARKTGFPAFDSLKVMLDETKPDLLDIILPPVAHAEVITAGLQAGLKTMICQKPFCRNFIEANEINTTVKEAGAQIVVHENFRFMPWYRALKLALADGLVGELQQVTFRLRPGDGQGDDAYLDRQPYFQQMKRFLIHETGVHWIDTFRYIVGSNPSAVYADLRQINPVIAGEDAGYVLFDFPGGVKAVFDGNRHLDHAADNHRRTMGEALIEGAKGTIQLYGDGSLWTREFGEIEERCLLPPDNWQGFGGDCVHALQSHVVSGLLDGTPLENLSEGYIKVIEIEDAIYRSNQTGSKVTLESD